MPETLLALSEVLLFGRVVEDIMVKPVSQSADKPATVVETKKNITQLKGHRRIDGIKVESGDIVLLTQQDTSTENGRHTVGGPSANWTAIASVLNETVLVAEGIDNGQTVWKTTATDTFTPFGPGGKGGLGYNNQLDKQLAGASFARIYGFSYEGTYYELPNPTLFLVHGTGVSATDGNQPTGGSGITDTDKHASRAPINPSVSGVAAADFQFADDIRVWAYDKADYTIRMDVETGMFEQVLLDVFFGVEAPMLAGGRVAGGRVAGGRVAGGRVAGGRVAGGRVSGGRVGGSSD